MLLKSPALVLKLVIGAVVTGIIHGYHKNRKDLTPSYFFMQTIYEVLLNEQDDSRVTIVSK